MPLSIAYLEAAAELPTRFPPSIWHAHEMAFGFGGAVVAGFLLTAIPNWTGRMPLQGVPLAGLAALWLLGRIAVLASNSAPALVSAALDLAFPAVFIFVVAREIATGRNWRNLPMVAALALLFIGNLLTHLEAMDLAATGAIGARVGVATLVMLIALIGGRITPSFTRNWLVKNSPAGVEPAPFGGLDRFALAATLVALVAWVAFPDAGLTAVPLIVAGAALFLRLIRWRGVSTRAEPMLFVLHLGYGWVALGLPAHRRQRTIGSHRSCSASTCAHRRRHRNNDARGDDPRNARPHRSPARRRSVDGRDLRRHNIGGHPAHRRAFHGRALLRSPRGRRRDVEPGLRPLRGALFRDGDDEALASNGVKASSRKGRPSLPTFLTRGQTCQAGYACVRCYK